MLPCRAAAGNSSPRNSLGKELWLGEKEKGRGRKEQRASCLGGCSQEVQ